MTTYTEASSETSLRDGTFMSIPKVGLKHSEYGPAVRFEGRQSLALVTTTAGDAQFFATSGGATLGSINHIYISPDALNVNLALIARNYTRYAFRKLRFIYVTRVATTQAGSGCLAYSTDGGETLAASNSFASIQALTPNVLFPFRKVTECLEASFSGQRTWMTEQDVATTAGYRQTVQGTLIGYPDSAIAAVNMGEILVEYVVDLYQPASDYGFTMIAKSIKRPDYDFWLAIAKLLEKDRETAYKIAGVERKVMRREFTEAELEFLASQLSIRKSTVTKDGLAVSHAFMPKGRECDCEKCKPSSS